MTIRDGALRKIELMKAGPFPGNKEGVFYYRFMSEMHCVVLWL
jgi:hypothetical protein